MKKLKLLSALLFISFPIAGMAEVHEKVQAALDWQLPPSDCKKPKKLVGAMQDIKDSDGVSNRFGFDSYMLNRYKRRFQRWETCVSDYRTALLEDFEELKDCAQYGLTRPQSEIILGKLTLIQATVLSPDGIAP